MPFGTNDEVVGAPKTFGANDEVISNAPPQEGLLSQLGRGIGRDIDIGKQVLSYPLNVLQQGMQSLGNLPTVAANYVRGAQPGMPNYVEPRFQAGYAPIQLLQPLQPSGLTEGGAGPLGIPPSPNYVSSPSITEKDTPRLFGAYNQLVNLINSAVAPENVLSLPAAFIPGVKVPGVSTPIRPGLAAFAGGQVAEMPQQVQQSLNVLLDPNKSKVEKGAALFNIGAQPALATGMLGESREAPLGPTGVQPEATTPLVQGDPGLPFIMGDQPVGIQEALRTRQPYQGTQPLVGQRPLNVEQRIVQPGEPLQNVGELLQQAIARKPEPLSGQLPTSGQEFTGINPVPGFQRTAEQQISARSEPTPTRELPSPEPGRELTTTQDLIDRRVQQQVIQRLQDQKSNVSRTLVDKLLNVGKEPTPLTAAEKTIFNETWEKVVADLNKQPQRYSSSINIDPDDLRPAIKIGARLLVGEVGETHADVLKRNGINPNDYPHRFEGRGYVSIKDPQTWHSRIESEQASGLKGTAEAGGLDSMDLPGAKMAAAMKAAGIGPEEIQRTITEYNKGQQQGMSRQQAEKVVKEFEQRRKEEIAFLKNSDSAQTKIVINARSGSIVAPLTAEEQAIVDDMETHGVEVPDDYGPPGNTYEQTKEYKKALEVLGKSGQLPLLKKGSQNALPIVRSNILPETPPSRDIQKVGQEIRQGTSKEGFTREKGQNTLRTTPAIGNFKSLVKQYLPGKEFNFTARKLEDFSIKDLKDTSDMLKQVHEQRLKTTTDPVALDVENSMYDELRARLYQLGENKGENVVSASVDELTKRRDELQARLQQQSHVPGTKGALTHAEEVMLNKQLTAVNDLINKQQSGTRYSSGISFDSNTLKQVKDVFEKGKRFLYNRERAPALLDAADNKARMEGRQQGHRLEVGLKHDKVDDVAVNFIREARNDPQMLQSFQEMVGTKNKTAAEGIARAIRDLPRLKPYADQLKQMLDKQLQVEQAKGIETEHLDNYVKHAYKDEDTGLISMGPGDVGVSTSFTKERSYPNYATAIMNGETPKELRASKLLESRVAAGQKLINRYVWADQLKGLKTADGRPFATDFVKVNGKKRAPEGYEPMELAPGVVVPIAKEYKNIIKSLTSESFLRSSTIGSALLRGEGEIKNKILLLDTYHMFRVMGIQSAMMHKVSFKKGFSLLDYDDATLGRMSRTGEITPETAQWVKENRPNANKLIANGLNVGRIAEVLSEKVRKEWPVMGVNVNIPGRLNNFIFEKLTRGAMMEIALDRFEKVKKQNPTWDDDTAASYVAKQINIRFGNLQRQGILKSQSARDLAQLAFLAPQWTEGMLQSELRTGKQLAQLPIDLARGRKRIGIAAQTTATGVLALVVANQVINLMTQGKPTWENEEGHKLDALMPGGYWFSPLSIMAEFTHDMSKYMRGGASAVEAAGRIVSNKLSPVLRSAEILRTGQDYAGNKLTSDERLKEAGKALFPTPLPLTGLTSDLPKQTGRQLYSALGLKTEPKYDTREDLISEKTGINADQDFVHRLAAEKVYQKEQPKLSPEKMEKVAERARENAIKRGSDLVKELPRADKNWLESRGLTLPGFDNKIDIRGIKVYLTKEEMEQYTQLHREAYSKALAVLKKAYDEMPDDETKAKLMSKLFSTVKAEAKTKMEMEMLNTKGKEKKKRFSVFDYLK